MAGTLIGFFEEVRGECWCGAQRFDVILHCLREDPLAAIGPELDGLYLRLDALDLAAGSAAARRVFS